MEEKGYRFRYKGKWGVLTFFQGEYRWREFDEEPINYYLMPYKIATQLKNKCWFKDEIEIVECGIIPKEYIKIPRGAYLYPIDNKFVKTLLKNNK